LKKIAALFDQPPLWQEEEPPKRRRPTAEDNEELIRVARVYPKYSLQEIIEAAEYPGTEPTARKRLKEANVKMKPKKKTKPKQRKMWLGPEETAYSDWVKNKKKENAKMRRQWAKEAEKI